MFINGQFFKLQMCLKCHMLKATGHNAWGTRDTTSTASTACLLIMSNCWKWEDYVPYLFTLPLLVTDSESMIDTTESKSAGESRCKDLRPSKSQRSMYVK